MGILLFIRNPYVIVHPQFWHEDAVVFLTEQRSLGLAAIVTPYSGYLLLFPRLVAQAAAWFPLELTPTIYVTATFAGWLYVGSLILTSSLFAKPIWAFVASLAWICVPHGGEVFLVLTNMQWAFAFGLLILLAEDPAAPRSRAHLGFAALAAFTGPFCLFLLPIALWRLFLNARNRRRPDPLGLLVLAAACVQLSVLVASSHRLQHTAAFDSGRLSLFLGIAVFPELFGTKAAFPSDMGLRLAGTFAGLAGAAWAAWTAVHGYSARRLLLLGGGLVLLGGLASCIATQGGAPTAFGDGQRYLFLPFAAYVCALIAALSHRRRGDRSGLLALGLLAATACYSSTRFIAPHYPYPDWTQVCRYLREGREVQIRVAPLFKTVTIRPDPTPAARRKPIP